MPSNSGFSGDLPPELDPRRGRTPPARPAAGAPLPPALDPRGRRVAQREAKSRAAAEPAYAATAGATGRDWHAIVGDRSSAASGAMLGLRIAAAALSLLVLIGSGFAWATYRNFTSDIKRVQIPLGAAAKAKNIDGSDQNILIVGNDDRDSATAAELKQLGTTKDGGTYNTDTMMLLHVPANGSQATVISFPRDSYVAIPGHGMNKLNSAYPDGVRDSGTQSKAAGAALLVQTIENMTGLSVDHFVQVDLLGFYRISNAIGGVSVCLNAAQNEPNSGINLPKGISVIKGTQALAFVRQRYGLPNGDLDRIKRQQYFLSAVFRKLSSAGTLLNPFSLEKLLGAVTKSMTVDATLDPLKLAQQMQNLTAGNVKFTTIPTSGFANNDAGSVVVVDTAGMPDFIDTLIGQDPQVALKNAQPAAVGSFTVDVLNASGVNLRATKNVAALTSLGFKALVGQGDPAPLAATTIQYPKGMEGGAKTLSAQVPGAKVVRSSTVTSVTLLLGTNNIQVKSLMPVATPATPAPTAKTPTAATPKTTTPAAASANAPAVTTAAQAGCIN